METKDKAPVLLSHEARSLAHFIIQGEAKRRELLEVARRLPSVSDVLLGEMERWVK